MKYFQNRCKFAVSKSLPNVNLESNVTTLDNVATPPSTANVSEPDPANDLIDNFCSPIEELPA